MVRVWINGREAGAGKVVATAVCGMSEPLRFGWLGSWDCFSGWCVRDLFAYSCACSVADVFASYRNGQ